MRGQPHYGVLERRNVVDNVNKVEYFIKPDPTSLWVAAGTADRWFLVVFDRSIPRDDPFKNYIVGEQSI